MDKNKIDVIVVGAGPSGISSAIIAARGGLKVVVVERASHFGTKNMFGGAFYLESIKELFGDEIASNFPYERIISEHRYVILNDENSISVSYKSNDKTTLSVFRYNFDSKLVELAKKEGVYFAPNTLVVDLLFDGKKVVGIKTNKEELRANIVIVAEGANSCLLNKCKLKEKTNPKSAILGVKETIRMPVEKINSIFNLKDNEGVKIQFFGGLSNKDADKDAKPPLAMGFLYTFKNMISIGVGISVKSLVDTKIKPYEYLDCLKNNEYVSRLIKDGEVVEYAAHLIPEGGYKEIPKLYRDGLLIVGDAANFVDSPHFEGTNLAIKSGILAGKTCVLAHKKNDFSKKTLKEYKKEVYKSFIISDMKTYKNVIKTLYDRRDGVFSYYPKKIGEFFEIFTLADNIPKKTKYKKFIFEFFFERGKHLILDVISFVKCAIEAVI